MLRKGHLQDKWCAEAVHEYKESRVGRVPEEVLVVGETQFDISTRQISVKLPGDVQC